jgi:hypothetical protein
MKKSILLTVMLSLSMAAGVFADTVLTMGLSDTINLGSLNKVKTMSQTISWDFEWYSFGHNDIGFYLDFFVGLPATLFYDTQQTYSTDIGFSTGLIIGVGFQKQLSSNLRLLMGIGPDFSFFGYQGSGNRSKISALLTALGVGGRANIVFEINPVLSFYVGAAAAYEFIGWGDITTTTFATRDNDTSGPGEYSIFSIRPCLGMGLSF